MEQSANERPAEATACTFLHRLKFEFEAAPVLLKKTCPVVSVAEDPTGSNIRHRAKRICLRDCKAHANSFGFLPFGPSGRSLSFPNASNHKCNAVRKDL